MQMPPGPPALGEGAPPPPPPERYAEGELVETDESAERRIDDEAANRRLVATTAALALLAVAVMITVFLLTQDTSGDEAQPGMAPPVTVPTATTAEPAPDIDPTELGDLVEDISAFVEDERGLEFDHEVPIAILSRSAYEERARASFDEDLEESEESEAAVRQLYTLRTALGLWDPLDDPITTMRDLVGVGSLGFYDPTTEEIVIGAAEITPLLQSTLAHELTHALDGQHAELDRTDLFERTDEAGLAFQATVEGDARRVQLAYEATLTADERQAIEDESGQLAADAEIDTFPPILLFEQQFVYDEGQSFVQALVDDGGNAAVDAAIEEPPGTTEEVLEPDTFASGVPPLHLTRPEADGEVVGEGEIGQLTLVALASFDGPVEGDGPEWNGDHYVMWVDEDTDRVCVRADVAGDAEGFESALQTWADQTGAEMEQVEAGLEITVCP
jgi:hypothetical protein